MIILYNAIKLAINFIPYKFWEIIANLISHLLTFFLKREKAIAVAQLKFALNLNADESIIILRKSFVNSILSVVEIFKLKHIFKTSKKQADNNENLNLKDTLGSVCFDNLDLVKSVLDENKGLIFLTSHYSNFDLMAAFFAYQGIQMSVMARQANNKNLQFILKKIREDYGAEMLWRDANSKTTSAWLKAIKSNRAICALIDQDVNLENKFCNFFNLEAAYPIAPVDLAIRFKKPILIGRVMRLKNCKFRIEMKRVAWEEEEDPQQYVLSEYSKYLEEQILLDPTQWVWWHRRWRRRPNVDYTNHPEQLMSTNKYIEWLNNLPNNSSCN